MHTPILIALASAPAVLLLTASALLKHRGRSARQAQPAAMLRTADLSAPELNQKGWRLGLLSPLLLVAGTAALLRLRWNTLPERFPIHWGINGQADHWASRSVTGVFGALLFDMALIGVLGMLGELIARSSPGHEGRTTMVKTNRTILITCSWFVTILICLVSLLPLSHSPTTFVPVVTMGVTAFSLGTIGYVVFCAFRMKRIMIAGQNSTDGQFWRAGVFYFNPGDSALMVPKRNGFGYTLNFGRPVCWLILAVILVVPLILPLLHHKGPQ